MVGKHERELRFGRLVAAGGVKEPAMKKQYVAGVELDALLRCDELAVGGVVGPQKKRGVEPLRRDVHDVRTRQDEKAAVLGEFASERDPHRDQLRPLERPIANVL